MDAVITTVSGRRIHLQRPPDPDAIDILDIYDSLSKQCRFNGQVKQFVSVAAHCIQVATAIRNEDNERKFVLEGLLHDAHEAYTGDVAKPIKDYMRKEDNLLFSILEDRIAGVIMNKWGLTHCVTKTELGLMYRPSPVVQQFDHMAFEYEDYMYRSDTGAGKNHASYFSNPKTYRDHKPYLKLFEELVM